MTRIITLAPIPDSSQLTEFARQEYFHLTDLTVLGTDIGLNVVTSYYHIEYHLAPILDKVMKIERRGNCDALIVGCFGDPGSEGASSGTHQSGARQR
jgi:Asp/Glu/hydantoin racemase